MNPSVVMGAGGILFVLIWLAVMIGGIVGWIFFLVAAWRGMRAHEAIAESLAVIAQNQQDKPWRE